ncbi:hypothetical protein B0H66DRAFT_358474 [Apodospora peruviana]|uniref:Uncharacterized protein n=1 Tax=Apodospora peruviana TaxID=516989 RepID=A0AAE0HVJ9_9PEZI|nr:hypothetical protein B0H66DRAFT_358474 [Apodospora peruviana]
MSCYDLVLLFLCGVDTCGNWTCYTRPWNLLVSWVRNMFKLISHLDAWLPLVRHIQVWKLDLGRITCVAKFLGVFNDSVVDDDVTKINDSTRTGEEWEAMDTGLTLELAAGYISRNDQKQHGMRTDGRFLFSGGVCYQLSWGRW